MPDYTVRTSLGIAASPDAAAIRRAVFMFEQGFENEFDDLDETSFHVVLYDGPTPIATARLFPDPDRSTPSRRVGHIGRVAVMKAYRGRGLGARVLAEVERAGAAQGYTAFVLGAQCRAAGFYERSGYRQTDELFDDEGCPHVMMIKETAP